MKRMLAWWKGLLALLAVVAFALALAWLPRAARQGPAAGQPAPTDTRLPERGVVSTDTPLPVILPTEVSSSMPAERVAPSPSPESAEIPLALPAPLPEGTIVFPVGQSGDDSTFKVLRYDPATDVLIEENVSSPLGNLRLSVEEFSVSPDRRFVAINLVYADGPGGEAYLISADGSPTFLRTGEYEGGRFLDWIPGTDNILVGFRPVAGAAIVNLQGEDFVPLLGSLVYSGAASPDGEWLALSSAGDPGCPDARQECFYFVKPDGSEGKFTPIPDKAWGGVTPPEITWSSDGKRIAYVDSFYEGWFQVRTVDAAGHNLQKLGPEKMECYSPVWSPDSAYLVYACEESEVDFYRYQDRTAWVSGIWLADVASGEARQIVAAEGKAAWWPTWQLDGSGIVFVSNRGGVNDLWFVRPDGTGLRQLTFDGQIAD